MGLFFIGFSDEFLAFASELTQQDKLRIEKLEAIIAEQEDELSQEEKTLRLVETEIADLHQQIQPLNKTFNQLQEDLGEARASESVLKQNVADLMKGIDQEILLAFLMNHQNPLEDFFANNSWSEKERLQLYYDAWMANKNNRIEDFEAALVELSDQVFVINKTSSKVDFQRQLLLDKWQQVERKKQRREQVINKISASILNSRTEIDRIKQDAIQLDNIVEVIESHPVETASFDDFNDNAEVVNCPVDVGKVAVNYGDKRENNQLSYNGIIVATYEGQPVRAISDGEIVFSQWLRNYGWLIIVQHAQDWVSLYGYNQTVQKQVGDLVRQGDKIATVGNSGGHDESALYFEIRKNTQPVNTNKWCSNKAS